MKRFSAVALSCLVIGTITGCGTSGPHPYSVSATRSAFTRSGFALKEVAADVSPGPVAEFSGHSFFTSVTVRVYASAKRANNSLWVFEGVTPPSFANAGNVTTAYTGPGTPVQAALRKLRSGS